MALIDTQIAQQNFETIRQAIGAILATELIAQTAVTNLGIASGSVWDERILPFNQDELPAINVWFDRNRYDLHDAEEKRGINTYVIDCAFNSKATDSSMNDKSSSRNAQRIAGIVSAILSSPQYLTLGLPAGTISTRIITGIEILRVRQADALMTVFGRVTMDVTSFETVTGITPYTIGSIHTVATLEESDKGFYYAVPTT